MTIETRPLRTAQLALLERLRQGEIVVMYSRYDAKPDMTYEKHTANYIVAKVERRQVIGVSTFRRFVDGGLIELVRTVDCITHKPAAGSTEIQYWRLTPAGRAVQP
jgi:hypothetical protein